MPSPFPGMDPYLEDPRIWPDVHHRLISVIAEQLLPELNRNYFTLIEERVYIADDQDLTSQYFVPDVSVARMDAPDEPGSLASTAVLDEPLTTVTIRDREVREAYITIRDRASHDIVTVIEVLSPTNKLRGSNGFESYKAKRESVLASTTHFVEIDLLRAGSRPAHFDTYRRVDYMIHVSPEWMRPKGHLWLLKLPQPLPTIKIPLRQDESLAPLKLQAVLNTVHERADYFRMIDYSKQPVPPLTPRQYEWAQSQVTEYLKKS